MEASFKDFGGDQRKARVYGDAEYEFRRFTTIGPETSAALLAGYGRSRVSLPPRERRCMAGTSPDARKDRFGGYADRRSEVRPYR